ncbi:uncharacterized protein ARMOST_17754 [Armillaria ostoyae]|uniref:Uncharacterized protein n=1 Tax=Armillaria ostoyae TaxID=47428 RepID=A0A284RZV6_ARMOS|nr:uncharacterized protein ARMOST_17754 [Armillaria ostoyae]
MPCIERTWAVVNAIVWSMKEMGPGSRHDTLDDHFAYHNFVKLIGLGDMLHKRLTEVENQVIAHRKYHGDFTRALPKLEYAEEWTAVVEEWDQDRSKLSPYLSVAEHVTEQNLKLKLKEDEHRAKACGEIPIHKISATSCLGLGLLIEDSHAIVSGEGELSSSELADVEMRRTNLEKLIEQFRKLQIVYMPGIALRIEREQEAATTAIEAEDDKLWFPSDLSEVVCNSICHSGLGPGTWTNNLRELNVKDMSSMYGSVMDLQETATEAINPEDQRQKKRKSEKHKDKPKDVLWIWMAEGSLGELGDDSDITDVRVHWLRSRARLLWWEEEIALLHEEQR